MPTPIKVKEGNEMLTSHSGLIHTGILLGSTDLKQRLATLPGIHLTNPAFSNSDIVFSMLELISIGKPYYDAIELFRPNPIFFNNALGISGCPSAPTLRQRIDQIGNAAEAPIKEASAGLVHKMAPTISPIETTAGVGQAGVGQAGVGQAGVGQAGVGQAGVGQAGVDRTIRFSGQQVLY